MKRGTVALLLPVCGLTGCRARQESEQAGAPSQHEPGQVADRPRTMEDILRSACAEAGLSAPGEIRTYDRDNLHDYIDGAAARYMGYSFDRAAVAEMNRDDEAYVVELYHFTRAEDAYGMWSTDSAGEVVEVGQRSAYGAGLLQFWQGSYLGRVFDTRYRQAARDAVIALGHALATGMGPDAELPELLSELPAEGLKGDPVFFHEQPVLNYLYYVSDGNLLRLGAETDVVFAKYLRGEGKAKLLVIRFPEEETARAARDAFVPGYLEVRLDAGPQLAQLEDAKWAGISEPVDLSLRVVLDASSREITDTLLTQPGSPRSASH